MGLGLGLVATPSTSGWCERSWSTSVSTLVRVRVRLRLRVRVRLRLRLRVRLKLRLRLRLSVHLGQVAAKLRPCDGVVEPANQVAPHGGM